MKNKIKQVLIAAAAVVLLSFTYTKVVTIKLTEEQMNFHWQTSAHS